MTSDAMEIKSAHSDACLRFHERRGDTFLVSASRISCAGELAVWVCQDTQEAQALAALFASMATDRKGWEGVREWASTEGEFVLRCSHDGQGHVLLDLTLKQDFDSWEPWHLRFCLVVDAGQLEGMAKDAKKLFGG